MKKIFLILILFFQAVFLFSQRGKHGALTVATPSLRVNEYTSLTANALAGATLLQVANSNLNANGRFAGNLQIGDLVMIIQMQGAQIKTFNSAGGQDSTYGEILNYNNCGNYELAQVFAIPNGTSIQLDCGLSKSYSSTGKAQVVRVPRYTTLTINAASSIFGDAWNGTIGGVVAMEVNGASVINGSVIATGLGFRGGTAVNDGSFGGTRYVDAGGGIVEGGEKGESIAGSAADYIALYNGAYSKGAPANGGGGGNTHNCGGGGGANGGALNNWTGYGVTNPAYAVAYDLEFAGRSAIVSPGGGKGGYGFSANNLNPNTNAPGLAAWGGGNRGKHGGHGGRALDYTTGRIFLGGGGGAGHVNNIINNSNTGGTGGAGGGIIYMLTYGSVSGTGTIVANGRNGINATSGSGFSLGGDDAGGGAGGGGTILISTSNNVAGVNLIANGGVGGNVTMSGGFSASNAAYGPGGGGGGGYIGLTAGAPPQTIAGGVSGIMNGALGSALIKTNFPPNGASNGNSGLTNQPLANYTLSATNTTICVNNSAILNAVSNQPLASFVWYSNLVGATQLGTGAAFTTSVFATPGTYTVFVGMCPGNYRIPVTITVLGGPTLTATSATICAGQTGTLTASGATTYTWSNAVLSATTTAAPLATTIYTVVGTSGSCSASATATINVNASGSIAVNSATICNGQTATLSAGAATGYTWSTAQNSQSIIVTPTTTSNYIINANIGSCIVSNTAVVTVNSSPTITVNNASICANQSATLISSGAISYVWNDGTTTNTNVVSPINATTYTVTGTQNGCTNTATASVMVTPNPTINVANVSICVGQTATATALGAANYTWNPNGIQSFGTTFTTSPPATNNYTVVGATNGCFGTATFVVNVGANLSVNFLNVPNSICAGQTVILQTISTATNYLWSNGSTTSSLAVAPATTTSYTINGNFAGCTGSNVATINVNPLPTLTLNTNPICSGQSATVSALGATNYTWSNGATNNSIVINPASTTNLSLTANNGICSNTASIQQIVNISPTVTINNPNICLGNSATLIANGAASYTWLPLGTISNTISVNPNSNATYSVLGSSAAGCTVLATSNVTVTTGGTIPLNNATICNGQTATIGTSASGVSYNWSNGAVSQTITVSPSLTTVYTQSVVNASGCTLSGTVQVSVIPAPILTITTNSGLTSLCSGATLTLAVSGSNSYTWNTGNNSNVIAVSPTASTTYFVNSNNANGCVSASSITLNVDTPPQLSISPAEGVICKGTTLSYSASGATTYEWNYDGNYFFGNPLVINSQKSFNIFLKGINGTCNSTTVFPISVSNLNAAFKAESNFVDYPGSLTFTNTSSSYTTVFWDFGNGQTSTSQNITNTLFENPGQQLVTLLATDQYGCKDTAYYIVEVGCLNGDLFVPNSFTPNGDGLNDTYKVFGGACVSKFELVIFDRWGIEVKHFKELTDEWDGTKKGIAMETGVYNYKLTFYLKEKKLITKYGHINLVR